MVAFLAIISSSPKVVEEDKPNRTMTSKKPVEDRPQQSSPAAGNPPGQPADPREATTDVETFQILKWLAEPAIGSPHIPELLAANEETYRPVIRPVVPILTVLDDGSVDEGEQIRIRKDSFVIGRSSGDLVIPNDTTVSGRHAEIRLTTSSGQRQWMLHNLESVNGTFVRVNTANLVDDAIIILGSRRFRLEKPVLKDPEPPDRNTLRMDQQAGSEQVWPSLIEASAKPNCLRFPLQAPRITAGRKGSGCDIQLDDPLIATLHAELVADASGGWKIVAKPTRNGVWVNTTATPLTSCCFFQCGEQRFKFVIP